MSKEVESTREELWMEYAALLAEESAMFSTFAHLHGMYASDESIQDGIRLRKELDVTPEQINDVLRLKRLERKS